MGRRTWNLEVDGGRVFDYRSRRGCVTTRSKLFTPVSTSSIIWYRPKGGEAVRSRR